MDTVITNDTKNNNNNDILTCIFIGYAIKSNTTNFVYFSEEVPKSDQLCHKKISRSLSSYNEGNLPPFLSKFNNWKKKTIPLPVAAVLK